MKHIYLIAWFSLAMSGCSSTGAGPLQLAPTAQDWEASFLRLSLLDQSSITRNPVSFAVSNPLDNSLYHMTAREKTNDLIEYERLDSVAICEGFNRAFGKGTTIRWNLVNAKSYEQLIAPSGIQTHNFDLIWTFRDSSGREVVTSGADSGPGVKIIWGASRQAIAAEANQAFALTFLRLVVQLEGKRQP